ncbi:MAG: sulfur carrier protein ThiS [Planctomycetes bacterium]|nr:sulfur carrier protein ThiS [Planctomycetota bacterium]
MRLRVNGETETYPDGITVRELLDSMGVSNRPVAVELNRKVIPRDKLGEKTLREDDSLEIITFVGGG